MSFHGGVLEEVNISIYVSNNVFVRTTLKYEEFDLLNISTIECF